jgi:DNA-binding NarL/FixJ family response regulator
MEKVRVFLADDHHVVRAGLRALVDNQADMEVIGEAGDGLSAVEQAQDLRPDVVVMDVSMPVMGGAKATALLKDACPDMRVLALTVHEDMGYLEQLIQAGASGYVLKRAAADDLIHAIRTVAQGGGYLDPTVTGLVMGGLANPEPAALTEREARLTEREEEVMRLVARGFTNREIAGRLDVSTKTIETHKARAMEKLGVAGRSEIVAYAVRRGWLSDANGDR